MRDSYGSYLPVFVFCGCMMAMCSFMFAMESCVRRLEERCHRTQLDQLEWDDEMFINVKEAEAAR